MFRTLKMVRWRRGSGWRAVRVGGVLLVVLCIWAALSHPTHTPHPQSQAADWSMDSAGFGIPAPIMSAGSDPDPIVFLSRPQARPHPLEEPAKIEDVDGSQGEADLTEPRDSHDVNPRYNLKAVVLSDGGPKLHRNQPFFRNKRLDIPEDYGEYGVDYEEEYEEDKGKNEDNAAEEEYKYEEDKGKNEDNAAEEKEYKYEEDKEDLEGKRNQKNNDVVVEEEEEEYEEEEMEKRKEEEDNVAVEELDDFRGKYDEDEPVLEDVGGEALKGTNQKPRKRKSGRKLRIMGKGKENTKSQKNEAEERASLNEKVDAVAKVKSPKLSFGGNLNNKKVANLDLQLIEKLDLKESGNHKQESIKFNLEADKQKNLRGGKLYPRGAEAVGKFNLNTSLAGKLPPQAALSNHSDMAGDQGYIALVMARRRARVVEVCGKYGLGPHAPPGSKPALKYPPTPSYEIFYIDRFDGLAWCPIYKAASTSWLYTFLTLAGISESYVRNTKKQVSQVARGVWPALEYLEAEQAVDTCLKFLIVRHPFERLVSAFRDKLENTNTGKEHGVDHFYQKYGKKIVAKYREGGETAAPPNNRYSQDMDDPSVPKPKGTEPTFPEFVRYLIDTDLVYYSDDHWMPYYLHCTPCLVDYDVIAKFETLNRDQNYVVQSAGLEDKIKPFWKHLTKGKKTADTVRKYFATITKTELLKLYSKYRLDFELFEYSMDEYLDYVMKSET